MRRFFIDLAVVALIALAVTAAIFGSVSVLDRLPKPTPSPSPSPTPSPSPSPTPIPIAMPDLSRILHLNGRFDFAHACPISPALALTNNHVQDAFFDNPAVGFLAHGFTSDLNPNQAVLLPINALRYTDLGLGITSVDVPFYHISPTAPVVGEQLWWIGYDWRTGADMLKTRPFTGQVERIRAGVIVIAATTVPGTSGSCILDARGQVVGIIAWSMSAEDGVDVTLGVGVWDPMPGLIPANIEDLVADARGR